MMDTPIKKEDIGSTFVKRILGFSMASWINCLISLVSTPIVTALFSPEEFGKINLFISYANILIPFVYLGFDQAYVRFYNDPSGKNNKVSLFKLCLGISSIAGAVVVLFVLICWKFYSINIIGYTSFNIAVCLAAYLIATFVMRFVNLKARMDNYIILFLIQSVLSTVIIKLAFVLVALYAPSANYAIAFRTVLLMLLSIVFLFIALKGSGLRKVDYSKEVMIGLTKFALPLFPTVFLVMLNTSLSLIILRKMISYSEVGIYSSALSIAYIITVVQAGLNTFWTPFVYEYYKEKSKIQKMHHIISFLMFGMALVIMAFRDIIYSVLVNENYWQGKLILGILLISPICETISETLGLGIELSKKTYLKLPVYIINIIVNISACLVLIPKFGIFGAAVANALASLSMLLVKTIIGERFYQCSNNYLKLIGGMLIVIANALFIYFIDSLFLRSLSTLLSILVLIIAYKGEYIYMVNYLFVTIRTLHKKRRI
mgnify:CR=1 FL=1